MLKTLIKPLENKPLNPRILDPYSTNLLEGKPNSLLCQTLNPAIRPEKILLKTHEWPINIGE